MFAEETNELIFQKHLNSNEHIKLPQMGRLLCTSENAAGGAPSSAWRSGEPVTLCEGH